MSNAPQRYVSPLRYPGGKAKVTNFIKLLMLENDLIGCEYVEPYAGGASVALSLLFEDYASSIHINDLNRGVYAFWNSVLHRTAEFCSLIEDVRLNVDEWRAQRELMLSESASELELGFASFYLNRTNRSGIIGGGVIGGLDQTGPWKIDARFPREELIRRVRRVARFRSRITVTRLDTIELLNSVKTVKASGKLYFLDPPYYVKGEGLYDNFYAHNDHVEVRNAMRNLRDPWIVSYDAAPEIMRMYEDCASLRYSLSYSASTRSVGSEVMFAAKSLALPDEFPPAVSTEQVVSKRMDLLSPA